MSPSCKHGPSTSSRGIKGKKPESNGRIGRRALGIQAKAKQYALPPLKEESRRCLQNLASYKFSWTIPDPHRLTRRSNEYVTFPRSRSAAVLVALFVGRSGDLYVLLSRRSESMRSYAGDTSLPGGKWEEGDRSMEDTARREAFEEIGLTRDKSKVPLLCILEPFLAAKSLLVTPVVVLILDNTLRPILNEPEVHSLFSHPLISFLSSTEPTAHFDKHSHDETNSAMSSPSTSYSPKRSSDENLDRIHMEYHSVVDFPWMYDRTRTLRMHRFLTGRETGGVKPVFGLTAAILIKVAAIGFGRDPDYEVSAPTQPTIQERVSIAMKNERLFIDAFREESEKVAKGGIEAISRARSRSRSRSDGQNKSVDGLGRKERSRL